MVPIPLAVPIVAGAIALFGGGITAINVFGNDVNMSSGPAATAGNYVIADFSVPILRESRVQAQLVCYERDVQVDTTVTSSLLGIEQLSKAKTVRTYATGVYTVDLAGFDESCIALDSSARTVTVTVPRTHLRYLVLDPNATEVIGVENGLLTYGELALTQDQQAQLDAHVYADMQSLLLSDAEFAQADEAAKVAIYDLLSPVVKAVSADWSLVVALGEAPQNRDLTNGELLEELPAAQTEAPAEQAE